MSSTRSSARSTLDMIRDLGVVPVITVDVPTVAEPLADALQRGGLPVAEITLRTDAGLETISRIRETNPAVLVGAGTVCTAAEAHAAIEAGARFLVSPGLDKQVVDTAHAADVAILPGVATATELMRARSMELSVLKLFPAEAVGGIRTLAAFASVFPDVRFVPTGGISPTTAAAYLQLGSVLAVGGSWIADSATIRAGEWAEIEQRAHNAVRLVETSR